MIVSSEIKELKQEVKDIREENIKLREDIVKLERRSKKFNIIVHGIKEDKEENILSVANNIIKNKLGVELESTSIRDIFRIGQQNLPRKIRPISIELAQYSLKNEILKNSFKLGGTGYYITHDLTPCDLQKQKILLDYQKIARESGLRTKLKKGKLLVDGKEYSTEDIASDPLGILDPPSNVTPESKTNQGKDETALTRLQSRRLRDDQPSDLRSKKQPNRE
ncbi:unnamed protein product [Phaedon cochleariae]|uniref:Endonuclease-reverse transcriptase n=1 Tax=Phaedon cochleariae TaxID=80249 RepID=A0A9N9X3U0_PHACE|nr:unnamed protein product [Phaedon cochleariae]